MRLNFRLKFGNFTLFGLLAKSQKLEGMTSEVVGDKEKRHYVFFDLENAPLEKIKKTLLNVQKKYNLGNIFIVSDFPKSYRAWCFTKVDFKTYLRILLDTEFLCYNFFYWTVYRGASTLRISPKKDRPKQKIIGILESFPEEIPKSIVHVVYDTGIGKRGKNLFLGE